jgi:UDP-glucose 4-epimerase
MNILLTGGIGYIGRHIAAVLINNGHNLVIVDNLSTSCIGDIQKLESVLGCAINFINADIRDTALVLGVINDYSIDCVVHLAALKIVSESFSKPVEYYDNNVGGMLSLLRAMNSAGCKSIIFSSSAAIYSETKSQPLTEDSTINGGSPYASTKLIGEKLLSELAASDRDWKMGILRYFNPVGCHESGLLGEGIEDHLSNLMPCIMRVVSGKSNFLKIYGGDFLTPDGTGVRDYIHVMDLAEGHLASIKALFEKGSHTLNLGAGRGYSVLEVLNKLQEIQGIKIPYQIVEKRKGDLPIVYASVERAVNFLNWKAKRSSLEDICESVQSELSRMKP